MIRDRNGALEKFIDYLPVMLTLGVIAGVGAHITLFGALIASLVALLFRKTNILFAPSIIFIMAAASFNIAFNGKQDTLIAMFFMASILSFFIKVPKISKEATFGFLSYLVLSCLALSLILILGNKTFSSINLIFHSTSNLLSSVNEASIIIACVFFAAYYYLSRTKLNCPVFFSFLIASIVSVIYHMDVPSLYLGFENFDPIATADFGRFPQLLFYSCLLSFILASWGENKAITGISGIISSFTGSSPSVVFSKNGNTIIEFLILLILSCFYYKFSPHIPISAAASAVFLKCIHTLIFQFKYFSRLNKKSKTIFALCFFFTFLNVAFGLICSYIITLFQNKRNKKSSVS